MCVFVDGNDTAERRRWIWPERGEASADVDKIHNLGRYWEGKSFTFFIDSEEKGLASRLWSLMVGILGFWREREKLRSKGSVECPLVYLCLQMISFLFFSPSAFSCWGAGEEQGAFGCCRSLYFAGCMRWRRGGCRRYRCTWNTCIFFMSPGPGSFER